MMKHGQFLVSLFVAGLLVSACAANDRTSSRALVTPKATSTFQATDNSLQQPTENRAPMQYVIGTPHAMEQTIATPAPFDGPTPNVSAIQEPTPTPFGSQQPMPEPTAFGAQPIQVQVPVVDSGTIDKTDGVSWSGAIVSGDDKYDHTLAGWVAFDLHVIPASNSGLVNATLNLGSCSTSGMPGDLAFDVIIFSIAQNPFASLPHACPARYNVTGVVQELLARGEYFKVMVSPSYTSANGTDDSILFDSPTLEITYYP
ncbi:MAG: hypothetical protein HY741_18610 [Chloroflexi bacterium]|nr:hypothetical protein [Chloroflexota bacterium]